MRSRYSEQFIAIVVLVVTLLAPLQPVAASGPSSNRILNYQIRLTSSSGVPVANGVQNITLTIYDAASGGTQLFSACTDDGTATGVPGQLEATFLNGTATILIGDTSSITCDVGTDDPVAIPATLFNNTAMYLGVQVGADAEMTPRKRITSSGYALNADRLDDLETSAAGGTGAFVPVTDSSGLLTLTGNPTTGQATITANPTAAANELIIDLKNAGSTVFSVDGEGDILSDGNFTVGDATTDRLTVSGEFVLGNIGSAPTGTNGMMYYDTGLNKFQCYENGSWVDCIPASATLTLQGAYDNDANGGDATITLNSTDGDLVLAGDQDLRFTSTGDAIFDTDTLYVDTSANSVGIGTTAPGAYLHVDKASGDSNLGLYVGVPVASFNATSQIYLNRGINAVGELNSTTATKSSAFSVVNEDNQTNNLTGITAVAYDTHTSGTRTSVIGVDAVAASNSSVVAANNLVGVSGAATYLGTNATDDIFLYGGNFSASQTSTATGAVEKLHGVNALARRSGPGYSERLSGVESTVIVNTTATDTVAEGVAFYADLRQFSASATWVNAYGLHVIPTVDTGAGTITNLYGVYIGDQSVGTALNYALYTDGSAPSYFEGSLGIGDDTPAAALSVGSGDLFQVSSAGDVNFNSSTPVVTVLNGETLTINDGTNTLCTIADGGTTGNLNCTGSATFGGLTTGFFVSSTTGGLLQTTAVASSVLAASLSDETGSSSGVAVFSNAPSITSPAVATSLTTGSTSFDLLNTTATTINFGGAATAMSIGIAGASGTLDLMGGSGSTGCSINGTTGTIVCAAGISSTTTLQQAYDNDGDSADATITTNSTDGELIIAGNQDFLVTTTGDSNFDSNSLVVDSSADRVGVGTASPGNKFQVVGGSSDEQTVNITSSDVNFTAASVTNSTGTAQFFMTAGGSTGVGVFSLGVTPNLASLEVNSTAGGVIGNRHAGSLMFGTNDVVRMTIATGGDVSMTGDLSVNGGDLDSTAGTLNIGATPATAVNLGAAAGLVNLGGGSASTGCTVDSSGNLVCAGTISGVGGAAFVQNGNSFGAAAVLGTNDANSLSFETNNTTYLTIASGGGFTLPVDTNWTLTGGVNGLSFDGTTFSVDATNNRIGVGTAAPTEELHVLTAQNSPTRLLVANGDTGSSAYAEVRIASDNNDFKFGVGSSTATGIGAGGNGYLGTDNNFALNLFTSGTERITITGTGDVGISDTTPDAKLDVVAAPSANDAANAGFILSMTDTGNITTGTVSHYGVQSILSENGTISGGTGNLYASYNRMVYSNAALAGTGNLTGVFGEASYNNASAPAGTVAVRGVNAYATGDMGTTGVTSHVALEANTGGTADNNYGLVVAGVTGATNNYGVYIANNISGGTINNALHSVSTQNSYMAGNLGLGDTTPAALLTVGNGDLFQVSSAGDVNFNSTTPVITQLNGETLTFNDGTNTLCQIADAGTTGNLTCTGDGGSFFKNGGNTFAGAAVLGTNDSNTLSFETAGTTWESISVTGQRTLAADTDYTLTGGVNGLSLDGTTFSVDATNNRIGLLTAAPTHTLTLGSTSTGIAAYNTVDQTTNYERGTLGWSANVYTLATSIGGTGTVRNLALSNGNIGMTFNHNTGTAYQTVLNGSNGSAQYVILTETQVGASLNGNITTRNTIPAIALGNAQSGASSFSATSGTQGIVYVSGLVNQTSTAGFDAFKVTPSYTTIGSGTYNGVLVNPSGTMTGSSSQVISDIRVNPTVTLTEPSSGSVSWIGINSDLTGVSVTAAAGTSNFIGGSFTVPVDADIASVTGIAVGSTTANATLQVGASIGANFDIDLSFVDTSPSIAVTNTGTISFTDGSNTLCAIADGGTTGTITCTGGIASTTTLQQAYDNDANGSDATITTNSTDGDIVIAGDQDLRFTATGDAIFDTTTLVVDSSADFVGVGTAAPAAKLDVAYTNAATDIDSIPGLQVVVTDSGDFTGTGAKFASVSSLTASGDYPADSVSLFGDYVSSSFVGTLADNGTVVEYGTYSQASSTVTPGGAGAALSVVGGAFGASGNISTTGITSHTGLSVSATGTADVNYGIRIGDVSGATANYALVSDSTTANVGIGDITPAALLTVGASDAFQVNTVGTITTSGDANINGGDLDSTASIFNIGATPTGTINLGAAAATTNINATGTSVNFNGGSGSTGCTINSIGSYTCSANFSTTSASVDIFNTNGATMNFAGASTALTIGATTGTATIRNATVTLTNATTLNINGASPSIVSSSTGTASLFNTNITAAGILGAATGNIDIAGGSGSTGCTIVGNTGALTCAGAITGAADSLDYVDFQDAMDLDANLTLDQASFAWVQSYSGTTGTAYTLASTSLTTGTLLNLAAQHIPTTNTAINGSNYQSIYQQTTLANTNGFTGFNFELQNNSTIAGNTENVVRIRNMSAGAATDLATNALLLLDNADTTSSGTTVVTNAIQITNSGGSGFTNFLETPTLDISAAGAITGATGITSSGTITFSGLSTTGLVHNSAAGVLSTSLLVAADVTNDTLNFAQFADAMTLDANTTVDMNAGTFALFNGTTTICPVGTCASSGQTLIIGNDSALWDINVSNTLGLYGTLDSTQGHLQLGSGGMRISGVSSRFGIGTTAPDSYTNIESTNVNALTDVGLAANYHLLLRDTTNTDGRGLGLAFSQTGTDNNIGASIIHRRVGSGSQGTLQFYTKQSTTDGADPVLALTIDESGYMLPQFRLNMPAHAANVGLNIPTNAGAPSSVTGTAEGDLVWDETNNVLYGYDAVGATFVALGAGGVTLQTAYTNDVDGSDVTITTTATDGDVVIAGDQDFRVTTTGDSIFDSTTLVVDSSANFVGIGTAGPAVPLDVRGTQFVANFTGSNTVSSVLQVINSAAASTWEVSVAGSAPASGLTAGSLYFWTGGNDQMTIDTSGNVGIGSSTPASRLDVDGNSNTTALRLRGTAETTEIGDLFMGAEGQLVLSTVNGADTEQYIDLRPEDNQYGLILRESDGTGITTFANMYVVDAADDYLNARVSNTTSSTAGLFLTAADLVGINDSTPDGTFDVTRASISSSATTENALVIDFSDTGVVTSSLDITNGLDINVSRTLATGGTINTFGADITVTADAAGAGTSTAVGIKTTVTGADFTYVLDADEDSTTRGIRLEALDRPIITRGHNAFTSGTYQGAGAWGLFMETNTLAFGIQNAASKQFQWTAYNLDSTAVDLMTLNIDGDLLPGTTEAQDLGSTGLRWNDLYLGGETIHLGTSLTDEATISYSSSNILSFGTDSTTNGDIAFFTDDLYLDKSTGYVGINDTTPDARFDVDATNAVNDVDFTGQGLTVTDSGNSGDFGGYTKNGLNVSTTYSGSTIDDSPGGPTLVGVNSATTYSGTMNTFGISTDTYLSASTNQLTFSGTLVTTAALARSHLYGSRVISNFTGATTGSTDGTITQYGTGVSVTGNLGTTANTLKYGVHSVLSGTADSSTAGYFSATGATANYALITGAGNVGIGNSAPASLFDVLSNYTVDATNVLSSIVATDTAATTTSRSKRGLSLSYDWSGGITSASNSSVRGLDLDASYSGTLNSSAPLLISGADIAASFGGTNTASGGLTLYGARIDASGAMGTNNTPSKTGVAITATGTATTNTGLSVSASGATNNYALLTTGGNVGIGDSTPDFGLDVEISSTTYIGGFTNTNTTNDSDGFFMQLSDTALATGNDFIELRNSAGTVIGQLEAASNTTSQFTGTSDARLKQNIVDYSGGLNVVRAMAVRNYDFIEDPNHETQIGFIAQELYGVYPEVVSVGGADPHQNPWGIAYGNMTPVLASAIKELDAVSLKDDGTGTYVADADEAATGGTTAVDSKQLSFLGSAWNGSAAVDKGFRLLSDVTSDTDYKLSVRTEAGTEVAYFGQDGDVAISGRFFPSDRGVLQTSKYLFYDGSAGLGGDMMRTNAAGWATGSYDFAEMFPSAQTLEAGELVMIDTENSTRVVRSQKDAEHPAYLLAGIISTRPGFLAGYNDPGTYPVALSGRVPTQVNTEGGNIAIGDPITVSSTPGVGTKATNSTYVVGIALEAYSGSGTGEITVFVKTGWYQNGMIQQASGSSSGNSGGSSLGTMQNSLDMSGYTIRNVGAISGFGDLWSIDGDGNFVTTGTVSTKIATGDGDVEVFATGSQKAEITVSGSAQLSNGVAHITFDPATVAIISSETALKVSVTLTADANGVFVTDKSAEGFTVRQIGGGTDSNATFDWVAIARRKGFDDAPAGEDGSEEEDDSGSQSGSGSGSGSGDGSDTPADDGSADDDGDAPTCSELGGTWDEEAGSCVMSGGDDKEPPAEEPPAEEPPAEQPPAEEPPAEEPPSEEPPSCSELGGTWDEEAGSCVMP